jgi:hypothetical protein
MRPPVLNVDQYGTARGRRVGEPPPKALNVVSGQWTEVLLIEGVVGLAFEERLDADDRRCVELEIAEALAEGPFRSCRAVEGLPLPLRIVVPVPVVVLGIGPERRRWRRRVKRGAPRRDTPETI